MRRHFVLLFLAVLFPPSLELCASGTRFFDFKKNYAHPYIFWITRLTPNQSGIKCQVKFLGWSEDCFSWPLMYVIFSRSMVAEWYYCNRILWQLLEDLAKRQSRCIPMSHWKLWWVSNNKINKKCYFQYIGICSYM